MVIDDKAIAISALTDAVETIERVLGITPYGVYSDVRVRLDILESRINNPNVPTPTVTNPFYIDGYGGVSISVGDGYPSESRNNGSLYLRRDGYTYEGVYAMRNGSWTLLPTDSWLAGGDLSGDYYSQTVIGMQGRAISSTTPTDGYNLTWNDGYSYWEPQIGFIASQDLSGTKTQQTVIGIQGNLISSDTPSDGYALVWNALESNWKPTNLPVVFDALSGSTNIRSNRIADQSLIDNTKIGITNFSSAPGSFIGVTQNYGTISGGYNNLVAGEYATISGGYNNSASGERSVIGGGSNNTIGAIGYGTNIVGGLSNTTSGNYATIVGGINNTITKPIMADDSYSSIVGGSNNFIQGSYDSIINGASNIINGDYSSISNGAINNIAGNHSTIISGINNLINGDNDLIVLGSNNVIVGSYTIISGLNNLSASMGTTIRGNSNTISINSDYSRANGQFNYITSEYSIADGYNNSASAKYGKAAGKLASSRIIGQQSFAVNNLSLAGDEQYSTMILDGYQLNGGQFNLTIPETSSNLTMEDGKSYDISLRILVVNTSGSPTCARYIYDILAHQESGTLILDVINEKDIDDNGTGWTITIGAVTNELTIQVDSVGFDNRRAMATVEWRELSRA